MERDFKGIWIPKEIWLNRSLSINEKIFLVEIDSLDNQQGCFASNDYFSDFFGLSKNRCSEIIKSLEKKGLLNISYQYLSGTKSIEKRIIKVVDISTRGIRETDRGIRETDKGYSENREDNNTLINNTINNTLDKKKKTDFDNLIEDYTENISLRNNIYEFIKMRKGIKASITTSGLKRIITKLDSLTTNDNEKIDILDNSIMNSWKGIFPLNKQKNNSANSKNEKSLKFNNFKAREYDYDNLEKKLLGWDKD